jgi:two-component system, OmpR family, sensor kinase
MVGGVLVTQVVSLAVVLIAPPPLPQAFSIVEIADVLETPAALPTTLQLRLVTDPGFETTTPREHRLAAQLAGRLDVPIGSIRLRVTDYSQRDAIGTPAGPMALGRRLMGKEGMAGLRDELIIGDFDAAMKLADGRWRMVVTPPKVLDAWQWRAIAWLFGTVIAILIPAYILARRLADPIARFAAAAESLGRDPEAPFVHLQGPVEIEALADAFNMMQQRLKRYVQDRTQMIGAIAHDLRTPLMRLNYLIEYAPTDIRFQAQREIDEMNVMIGSVLDFVRDRLETPNRERVDLRSVVESVVENYADTGACISLEPGTEPVVYADLRGLRSIFANLVGNAVKYGDSAIVSIDTGPQHAMVFIDDDGIGLAESELERVFEPFYRGEPSRNRDTGGIGLGLAIVRTVAHAHGGEVTLHNRPEGGLRARVLLPL